MQRTRSVYIKLVMTTFFRGGTFVAGKWAVGTLGKPEKA
jgi:hypothetical protein